MFSASANTITKIQLLTGVLSLIGIFYVDFTIGNVLLTIFSFYIYSIIGVGLTMHRYYTHRVFEFKYSVIKWLFTLIAVLSGRGSPIGWVYIHRLHHAFSDTNKDPHSPASLGFKLFGFKPIAEHSGKMNYFLVKDLMNSTQLKINEYYFLIMLVVVLSLLSVNVSLLYCVWIFPVFLLQLSQNSFNYFAHTVGYRNFNTQDNSTNNVWLWPFILGDAWHNNHHANAAMATTRVKKYEFDPVVLLINLIKK